MGFTHARAFAFNRDPRAAQCSSIVAGDGRLCPSAQMPGVTLSSDQLARAVAAFTAPSRHPDTAPWCFEPHHGIVLYDDADKPVAAMSICFECEREGLWPASAEYQDQPLSPDAERVFRRLLFEELGLSPSGG